MTHLMLRLLRASIVLVVVTAVTPWSAAAQTEPPTSPAQQPGKVTTMPDHLRGKLDAFLKRAVDDKRPELLRVMIRLAARDGADTRVADLLEKLGLKTDRTLSGGRLLLTTLKVENLPDLVDSEDVLGVSFDAIVKPQGPGV